MKESTQQLMLNAEETLLAAEMLLDKGFLRDAVNRGYYSVFYIAESMLNEKDLRYSKHGTVHGAFSQHFIKTGLFDAKYHKLLTKSFGQRMLGDYDEVTRFTADEVRQTLAQTWEFLKVAKEYLAQPLD